MGCLKTPLLQQQNPLCPPPKLFIGSSAYNYKSPFARPELPAPKKRAPGVRSWIRIDNSGNVQLMDLDKLKIMRRCQLPARDLRLLDPLLVYPSTILGREKAIVVNLEQIRCVITAEEVFLMNSFDQYVMHYVAELQRRICGKIDKHGLAWKDEENLLQVNVHGNHVDISPDTLPFEFKALEVALEETCTFLDCQATELEEEAYPLLEELTLQIMTLNLERLRRLKSRLVHLKSKVQKIRDELEQLMDDDEDMGEMHLTEKKQHECTFRGISVSAPVSPVSSPPKDRLLEKSASSIGRLGGDKMPETGVEELEMLLEAYFVVVDGILNKLTSLEEYIGDTEDMINIHLDNVRNKLIQFELLLTTGTFVLGIFSVVVGTFGMNIPISLYQKPGAFKWVLIITAFIGLVIFLAFISFFRWRKLMPL